MATPAGETVSEELKQLCWNNAEFYKKDDSENGQRLRLGFIGIVDHVNTILPLVQSIEKLMPNYDFDETTPGNGYRSFVIVVEASLKHALQLCSYISVNRESLIFRKGLYMKEVEAASHMIASLASCFQHLHTLLNWSEPGELFPSSDHYSEIILEQSDTVNQYAFYGRCLAIQFCSSVQPLLKFISTFMASFSEIYYNFGGLSAKAQSLFSGSNDGRINEGYEWAAYGNGEDNIILSGGKFLIDPELRARRIVNISLYASIDFCKSFWFLAESELMKKIPDFVCNTISINTQIEIPPEPLQTENSQGVKIDIPIPSSHIKVKPIKVRLLSNNRHEGMVSVSPDSGKKGTVVPTSGSIILHCHGGGFVAQSSKSHEVYLRDWAGALNVPIVSVDYSLAPEAPFPRALEEVFYVYCWILKNSKILGSTGEKIILAGDSAGANLLLGVALKCIEHDIRKPNGLFLAYVPVIVSSTPSPSRLLCLMDPLLPIGFLLRCLKAYACPREPDTNAQKSKSEPTRKLSKPSSLKQPDNNSNENSEPNFMKNAVCEVAQCSAEGSTPFLNPCDKLDSCEDLTKTLGLSMDWEADAEKYPNLEVEEIQGVDDGSGKHFKNTFNSMKKRVSSLISHTFKMMSKRDIDKALAGNDAENLVNPFKEFKFSVPRDPYLSPYWASDDVLRKLPPTSICSVQFDPCLDDCVMFAKKLKRLGNAVTLDILEGLPHGFLNFCKVNKDAEEGSKLCIGRIKNLLHGETPSEGRPREENGQLENHLPSMS